MELWIGLGIMVCALLAAYFYGVYVGLKGGKTIGRRQADAEWAVMLEAGMIGGV